MFKELSLMCFTCHLLLINNHLGKLSSNQLMPSNYYFIPHSLFTCLLTPITSSEAMARGPVLSILKPPGQPSSSIRSAPSQTSVTGSSSDDYASPRFDKLICLLEEAGTDDCKRCVSHKRLDLCGKCGSRCGSGSERDPSPEEFKAFTCFVENSQGDGCKRCLETKTDKECYGCEGELSDCFPDHSP